MKTYQQFSEDIGQRRQELLHRSKEQMQKFKEKSISFVNAQRRKASKDAERKRMKDEIKSELRSEN